MYLVKKLLLSLVISSLVLLAKGRIPDEPSVSTAITTTTETVPTEPPEIIEPPTCFYAEEELCQMPRNNTDCKECFVHPVYTNSLVCCNVTDIERSISCVPKPNNSDNSMYWSNIHLRNVTAKSLEIKDKYLQELNSLIVTDGKIERIIFEFKKFNSLKCINISNNNLIEINPRAFKDIVTLQVLDVSYNNLTTLSSLNSIPNNLTLTVKGNNNLLCNNVVELISKSVVHIQDSDNSYCVLNQTYVWFNTTEKATVRQMELHLQLQAECPRIEGFGNCTCSFDRMIYVERKLAFYFGVNCSGLGLLELPKVLPANTMTLDVSNNNISNLAPLNDNIYYKHLLYFLANDNQISSLRDLEGSTFLEDFERFEIKRNKIVSIPTYLFQPTFDRGNTKAFLFMEGNQLICDCNSLKVVKLWLMSQSHHVLDAQQILCNSPPLSILDVSEKDICQSHHDWTNYIYILITVEMLLLILLIIKVSYDYWVFKTAGYLPWPASKMPKLPCDWLCET